MIAMIYDELFDTEPITLENIRSVSYTSTGGLLRLHFTGRDEKEHTYIVRMDNAQYKRRVEFI